MKNIGKMVKVVRKDDPNYKRIGLIYNLSIGNHRTGERDYYSVQFPGGIGGLYYANEIKEVTLKVISQ